MKSLISFLLLLGFSGLALADPAAPIPNKGDVAWMLTSTALVLLMSIPALALFYGGLVRSKNMLSVLMQVFVTFSLIIVLWCIYGYSLAFTEGNAFIGGLSRLFLNGTFDPADGSFSNAATFSKGVVLPELVYVAFQATFAAITCCLIVGCLRRAHQVLGGAAVHGAVVHVQLPADRAHGVVLGGSGCLHQRRRGRCGERQGGACLAVGRARLRGRHRRAHQRRRCRPGRRLHGWQAHRLRQGVDGAAQPDDDDDRRLAAVVRLVRLQRRLRSGSQRHRPRSPS